MKYLSIVRNIPFLDCKGLGFYFKRLNNRYWIEAPFIAVTFKLK
jgi:hypothetical protein